MAFDESSSSSSDSDSDSELQVAMQSLKRACSIAGTGADNDLPESSASESESEDEAQLLLRRIEQRFSVGTEDDPISMKPLQTILPSPEDEDENADYGEDFETLRAIQRRFAQYDDSGNVCMESSVQRSEQVGATNNIDMGKESSPNFFVKRVNNGRGFPDCVDGRATNQNLDDSSNINAEDAPNANVSEGHEPGSELVPVRDGSFPSSAQAFVEAIKKNRTCQKLIRNKLAQIGARMEENKKLIERVKILKDFQTTCRIRTGRALSQKKDARIQLISIPKMRANASKVKDKKTHAIYQGPAENSHVAHYRVAVSKYPFSLSREPWSKKEKKKLLKGIRQQFQEMLTRNLLSDGDGDLCHRVKLIESIKYHEITCDKLKSFIDKVNWERLASIYLTGRSAPECESRWRNCEDPSINHGRWTVNEDKMLLHIVSNRGISNWIKIAMELKTNRTPFQCLSRFQRSLNASIIKNEWTPPEDEELRKAVAEYGETNWQLVASTLEGRTGTQCSNRWKKSLNPLRERVGKWDPDEDKRLKITVRLFGAKNWNKIAKFVPGRTQVQCRERWVNCLDPCLNLNEWTEEEDLKLEKAIEEYGHHCWSKIAASIPPRTDSQCLRRWKVLHPEEFHKLRIERNLKKTALISNFVDREGERPDLTAKDFTPLLMDSDPKANEDLQASNKKNRRITCIKRYTRTRRVTHTKTVSKLTDEDAVAGHADITISGVGPTAFDAQNAETKKQAIGNWKGNQRDVPKIRSRRARQVTHTEKVLRLIDEDDVEYNDGHSGFLDKNNVRKSRLLDGDNDSEIERKATRKRKRNQREKEDEKMVGISAKKEKIDCGFDDERRSICSSSSEKRGVTELKVYFRRRSRKHSLERCTNRKTSEQVGLDDEETLGSFLIKLKKEKNE